MTRLKLAPEGDRRSDDRRGRAPARRRIRAKARARAADARLADSAQGRAGCEGFAAPAGLRRNGAHPPRLRRRSARARRRLAQTWPRPRSRRRDRRRKRRQARRAARRERFGACAPSRQASPAPVAPRHRRAVASPGVRLARFEDVVALARAKRDIQLQAALESDVRPVRFEAGTHRILADRRRLAADRPDPVAPLAGMDRRALDGHARRGLHGADAARKRRGARSRSGSAASPPIRWCARSWRAFPAPRSSKCAVRDSAAPPPEAVPGGR